MSALRWIRHGVFIIVQVGNTGGCMNRLEMVTQLVQNEIDWLEVTLVLRMFNPLLSSFLQVDSVSIPMRTSNTCTQI